MTLRLVVLGAGYAGLTAAKLAAKHTNATVTLVNNRDRFVERVRNHQLASGQQLRDLPLHDLLEGTGIRLVVDEVTRIDPERRQVELERAGEPVGYDLLVVALGSHADLDAVPGAAEHATAVAGAEQAERLRGRLRTAATVVVVGGGLTGIETVTELAETYPDRTVRLVTGGPLGEKLSARGRQHLHRTFDRLGIHVWEHARVAKVAADGVLLEDGEHLDADVVVWTTGFRVPRLARHAGLAVDERGRMLVDASLRSVSHPEVYGVGDAAAARNHHGQELRMACATGGPAAVVATRAITAQLTGRTPRPLRFTYVGQCISLGRRDGLIQFTRPDDSPRKVVLTGRAAALYKESVVRMAAYGMRHPLLAELGAPALA